MTVFLSSIPYSYGVRDFFYLYRKDEQDVELIQDGATLTAVLNGEIDHHSARDAREHIDAAVLRGQVQLLRLDFGGVSFMDSSGIGLIMGRYRLMQGVGGKVEVVRASKRMKKLMEMAGLGLLNVIRNDEQRKDGQK